MGGGDSPVSEPFLCLVQDHVFFHRPVSFLDVWIQMIEPTLTTLLPDPSREL